MAFTVSETSFGTLPALIIAGAGSRAVVALRGATLVSWTVDGVELLDGYADEQELLDQAGMRSAIMVPFSNRIRDGRYVFDGREINFHEGNAERADETVLHGLTRNFDFAVADVSQSATSATVRFVTRELRPGASPGYPFSVDVIVDMTLTGSGIEIAIEGTNVGDGAAPFASGWHPYFRIGDAPLDGLVLHIPSSTRVVPDVALIPLEGPAAFEPVSGAFDLREPQAIAGRELDAAFVNLELAPDGRAHTTLTDPQSGRTLDVWQEHGLMHVFTADGVTRPRESLAMESVEVMTNAVNRADQAAAIRLEPQQRRVFRFGVTTTTEDV